MQIALCVGYLYTSKYLKGEFFMAGYIWHMIHGYETYMHLSKKTKTKMPKDALRSFMIGVIIPDLATGEQKENTHFYMDHPIYGKSYQIPNMEKVEKLFLKKDPTYLGVLSHLKYDKDHVERFLLVYAKPCANNEYENTITGETMSGLALWGDWKNVYGQLYMFYDKFNSEMAVKFTPKLNAFFGTNFSADKDGFLAFVKWLFPENVPVSGIPEMDKYRTTNDIYEILKNFFESDGKDCKLSANIDDLVKIVRESAVELAKKIDKLYAN